MRLTKVGRGCDGGPCPTVYETDRGTYVVQGAVVTDGEAPGLTVPAGETLVEIPRSLLIDLLPRTEAG